MPRPGTPHPEIPFISVDNATAQVSEGDIAQITCNYAGTDNTTNDPNKTSYTLGLSLSEEPLLSHKKFRDIDEDELEALQAIISGKDKDSSGTPYKDKVESAVGKKALEKIQRGQTSYYSPKVTWRQATVRKASAASSRRAQDRQDRRTGRAAAISIRRPQLALQRCHSNPGGRILPHRARVDRQRPGRMGRGHLRRLTAMRLPPKKRPGNPILASDWNTLIEALEARTPRPSAGLDLISVSGGFAYRVRQMGGGSATIPGEPFAEIITWKDGETKKTGIRGGVVYAGDKVWNVDHKALNLEASGTFKAYLEVSVTANVEDGVLLPGIKTSTAPEWKQVSGDGQYPNQTIPTAPAGTGKAIIAIGILTIEDGSATLMPAGGGSISIDHCPGTLSHTRV